MLFFKKSFITLCLGISFAFANEGAAKIDSIWNPSLCKECHKEQYMAWKTSLHAKSHEESNELYKVLIDYTSKALYKPRNETVTECGACHNPKLKIKQVDPNIALSKIYGIEVKSLQNMEKTIQSEIDSDMVKTGMSCYICHNIDKINKQKHEQDVGYKRFEWARGILITGPYEGDENYIFHKTAKRDFFRENDELCLSCHQGMGSKMKFSAYNTGIESTKNAQRCTDCHMGDTKMNYLSPNLKVDTLQKREIKNHFFRGVRNSRILNEAIDLSFEKISNSKAKLTLHNLVSHNVPTGFGGRSIVIKISAMSKTGEILANNDFTLRTIYNKADGSETFQYSAFTLSKDTRLKAFENRSYDLQIPDGTKSVKVEVIYYVIAPELQNLIDIKDETFTKPYKAISRIFKF